MVRRLVGVQVQVPYGLHLFYGSPGILRPT